MTLDSIKWEGNALSGATFSDTYPIQGDEYSPTGYVHRVYMKANSTAGSIFFQESGTGEVIATLAAGSNVTDVGYPTAVREDNAGAAVSAGDNLATRFLVTNPVFITGSGFTSGTDNVLGTVELQFEKV